MERKKFNPAEWKDSRPEQPPKEPQEQPRPRTAPANPGWMASLEEQIEEVTRRIEASGTDITSGYRNWLDLGFALSDALGEQGRLHFHRLSRFYPGYNEKEADTQYTSCLKAGRGGITARTFFHLAKEHGISVRFPSESSKTSNPSVEVFEGNEVFEGICPPEEMPTFSQHLYGHLPGLLDEVARCATSNEDADVLLLGAIVTLSSCLTKVYGVYGGRQVYPNLFLFVTAPASAGKGKLTLCRRLVQPIHDQLRDYSRSAMDEYRIQKARYEHEKKKHPDLDPPEEPPLRTLIIPANSSATSVYQILNDNGGGGLMFETEGDTLANVFASDFGNFSDGFRKAFHHEAISYTRRKDREFVELMRPKLSAVLSGTPRQICALIPDAENGLFSRFIFYYVNFKLEWLDVFARTAGTTLDERFDDIGYGFMDCYQRLDMQPETEFRLTPSQQEAFNAYYSTTQTEYHLLFGDDIIASVRRLGLITFRLAMILTVLRTFDTGEDAATYTCDDEDFDSAMAISRVLIRHTVRVYRELSSSDLAKPSFERTERQQQFLAALPPRFTTRTFLEYASRLGIPQKSAERYIKNWCSAGFLHRQRQGLYEKSDNPKESNTQ